MAAHFNHSSGKNLAVVIQKENVICMRQHLQYWGYNMDQVSNLSLTFTSHLWPYPAKRSPTLARTLGCDSSAMPGPLDCSHKMHQVSASLFDCAIRWGRAHKSLKIICLYVMYYTVMVMWQDAMPWVQFQYIVKICSGEGGPAGLFLFNILCFCFLKILLGLVISK